MLLAEIGQRRAIQYTRDWTKILSRANAYILGLQTFGLVASAELWKPNNRARRRENGKNHKLAHKFEFRNDDLEMARELTLTTEQFL